MGRPSIYTPEIAAIICKRLAAGESLRSICKDEGMPGDSTVRQWAIDDVQGFSAQYARARDIGLDTLADEILEIANTPVVGKIETDKVDKNGGPYTEVRRADMIEHRRLQVDSRKWYLSKLAPKKYGDRLEIDGNLNVGLADRLLKSRKRAGA